MRNFVRSLLFLAFASATAVVHSADRPEVYTVNYPLAYFAERIGGDDVTVTFPEMEGDPAFWKPDVATIRAYAKADLVLLNGADYAQWINKASLPKSILVDTSESFKDRFIAAPHTFRHTHGQEGTHSHGGHATTTWIDPQLAILQAETITNAFKKLVPHKADQFDSRFRSLKRELETLDKDLEAAFEALNEQPLIASHPVYQYLAERYQLNLESVSWEPNMVLTNAHLSDLRRLLRKHHARWMIWEDTPEKETVEKLSGSTHVDSIVFCPCANRPLEGDYMKIMENNIANLKEVAEWINDQ